MSPSQGLPASKPIEGLRTFGDGCVRQVFEAAKTRRLAMMGFPQGLTASKSVGKPRTFGDECVGHVLLMNVSG